MQVFRILLTGWLCLVLVCGGQPWQRLFTDAGSGCPASCCCSEADGGISCMGDQAEDSAFCRACPCGEHPFPAHLQFQNQPKYWNSTDSAWVNRIRLREWSIHKTWPLQAFDPMPDPPPPRCFMVNSLSSVAAYF